MDNSLASFGGKVYSSPFRGKTKTTHSVGGYLLQVYIDDLSSNEVEFFISIIEDIGYWGKNAGWSDRKKINFIKIENNSVISSSLLSLFESPYIKNKVTLLLDRLLDNEKYQSLIFAISFLNFLDVPLRDSLISEISGNNDIYKISLVNDPSFNQIFNVKDGSIQPKSSLFSLFLIKNYFTPTSIIDHLHNIAKTLDSVSKTEVQKMIFKSTLRFSFVERLLPENNKKDNLARYYEGLKSEVIWLKGDPHYWLQYGMSAIQFQDFDKAQQYFNQSYSLARARKNYHTKNIDTQQARLYLLISIDKNNDDSLELFMKADKILSNLENDNYKFRSVQKYKEFYQICYENLPVGGKAYFKSSCAKMKESIQKLYDSESIIGGRIKYLKKSGDDIDWILSAIETGKI